MTSREAARRPRLTRRSPTPFRSRSQRLSPGRNLLSGRFRPLSRPWVKGAQMTVAKAEAPQRSRTEALAASPVLWLLPLTVILLATFIFPIFEIARLSFTNANLVGSDYEYTLGSYASLFTSPYFFNMLKVTAIFVFISVTCQMIFGFLIALAVDQGARRGMRVSIITRTAVLSAWAIPGVLIGIIWSILYQQSAGGILNYALSLVGLGPVPFLSDPEIALASVTIANIWRGTAFSKIGRAHV